MEAAVKNYENAYQIVDFYTSLLLISDVKRRRYERELVAAMKRRGVREVYTRFGRVERKD